MISTLLEITNLIAFLGGPWSPFENNWHLKEDYKKLNKRQELARSLSKHIFWVGIANFVLCFPILIWQALYTFFNYAEVSNYAYLWQSMRFLTLIINTNI